VLETGPQLAFIATLRESGVEFVAVDNSHANKLTVHTVSPAELPGRSLPTPSWRRYAHFRSARL
jgi:hypothetical protein